MEFHPNTDPNVGNLVIPFLLLFFCFALAIDVVLHFVYQVLYVLQVVTRFVAFYIV